MKRTLLLCWPLLAASALALASPPGPKAAGEAPAAPDNPLLTRMKSLAGTWRSQMGPDRSTTVTYKVTGGGKCVAESMSLGPDKDMLTMYCADGDAMMATHFCDGGTQPRMRAERISADGKTIDFQFKDITNLQRPDAPHMRAVRFTWASDKSVAQRWESGGPEGKTSPMVFNLTRVK